jgi:hypothetical protein
MSTVPPLCGTYRVSQCEQYVVLHGIKEKTCLLIDMATSDDSNVNRQKKLKKLRKGNGPEIEVSRMWKARTSYNCSIRKK